MKSEVDRRSSEEELGSLDFETFSPIFSILLKRVHIWTYFFRSLANYRGVIKGTLTGWWWGFISIASNADRDWVDSNIFPVFLTLFVRILTLFPAILTLFLVILTLFVRILTFFCNLRKPRAKLDEWGIWWYHDAQFANTASSLPYFDRSRAQIWVFNRSVTLFSILIWTFSGRERLSFWEKNYKNSSKFFPIKRENWYNTMMEPLFDDRRNGFVCEGSHKFRRLMSS